jgi:hypothetical protein
VTAGGLVFVSFFPYWPVSYTAAPVVQTTGGVRVCVCMAHIGPCITVHIVHIVRCYCSWGLDYMDSEIQMCFWWSRSEHGAGSYSGQRRKEVVVDGWGSWNFTLNNPILCRIERKIVWSSFPSFYRRAYLFGTFCGWFVFVLGWVCWRVSGCVEFSLVPLGISSLLFSFLI